MVMKLDAARQMCGAKFKEPGSHQQDAKNKFDKLPKEAVKPFKSHFQSCKEVVVAKLKESVRLIFK